jgi:hypothetical protein
MLFPVLLTAAAVVGGPTIWIVDDDAGPGVDFADLPAAIAAAADGDTLVVFPGAYSGFALNGKALRVVAADTFVGAGVGPSSVSGQNVSEVFLQGLTFVAGPGSPAFVVSGGARAFLADCNLFGGVATEALRVDGAEAHVGRTVCFGGPALGAAGPGVRVVNGGLCAFDAAVVVGGEGLSAGFAAGSGGHALLVDGGTATAGRSSFFGGGVPILFGVSATAGDGVRVTNGFARLAGDGNDVVAGGSAYGVVIGFVATTPGTGVRTIGPGAATVHGGVLVLGGEGVVAGAGATTLGLGVNPPGVALPRLDVYGDATATGFMTVLLEQGPPFAPFAVLMSHAAGFPTVTGFPLAGDLQLDLAQTFPAFFGTLDATGAFTMGGPFGAVYLFLVGIPLHMQVGVFDGTTWLLTNPVAHFLD